MTAGPSSQQPWSGGRFGAAECVLAPNASPWTLDGTNTWLLIGDGVSIVIDPGPLGGGHRERILDSADRHDAPITGIVLTHGHIDHSEGARELGEHLGVGVRALDPMHRLGGEGLVEGDRIESPGLSVRVIATPGHSSDSVCLIHDGALLTGDTVLGRGTTLVAWPDGQLGDYLLSLERLREVAEREGMQRILPGHGPVVDDPIATVEAYLAHRRERLEQVRAAADSGLVTARAIVEHVYADVPREVWPAAEQTVRAQLAYLGLPPDA